MKSFVLPLTLTLLPFIILLLILPITNRSRKIPVLARVLIGLVFTIAGMASAFYACGISIDDLSARGIRCMTGVVTFPFVGVLLYMVATPLLLIFYRRADKPTINSTLQHK